MFKQNENRRQWTRRPAQFWVGLILILGIIFVAIFAKWLSPHDYAQQNLTKGMLPPVWMEGSDPAYLLGTDRLGRDLLSRLMFGARVSAAVGLFSVLIGGAIGITLGMIAGYFGGGVDRLLTRLMDIQLSFPPVFLAIAIIAAMGQSLTNLIIVLGLVSWVQYARVSRGATLSLRNQEFMLAARAIGVGTGRMIWRHLLPSVLPPLAVIATVNMSAMILNEASLSFLGLGVQPPTPAWGSMVSEARSIMSIAWWNAVFPGVAIALFVIGGNLMGDGLSRRKD
ncbi:MAG: ABC transporter permease [Caldilineaceae bacterium]|nr:ABC transporter permease [Caldilineaceae bacterium]